MNSPINEHPEHTSDQTPDQTPNGSLDPMTDPATDAMLALTPDLPPQEPIPPKRPAYPGYTAKEKCLPCLLLALFAPLALCFFGPFEIFGNNMGEFKFLLWDFWGLCAVIAVAAAALIFGLLMLLRGRAFDICFGLIFGLSLMLFLQGNYLSLGTGALSGDGVGEGISTLKSVINIVIWAVIVLGCAVAVPLLRRFKEAVRLVSIIALCAFIGMTAVNFLLVSLSTDVYATEKVGYQGDLTIENEVLTVKNLDTLATDKNIVVFIVDRMDHTYFDEAMEVCPEIFADLDGFTHFDDYITLYPRTYPGVPHLLTGVEIDFTTSRLDYMQDAYSSSPYWAELKAKGYDINVYTDDFYGYDNATHMRDFVSNTSGNIGYKIVDRAWLSLDMIRLSLYRYFPFCLQGLLGEVSTPMFDRYASYDTEHPVFSTNMKDAYEVMTDAPFTFRNAEKGISFIHLAGCHTPNAYGPDFDAPTPEERNDTNVAMKQSFKIISAYINEMKRMGVYEDSTILILGDHCSIGADRYAVNKPRVTTLLAKPAGVSTGALKESKAQIATDDVFATVLTAIGSDKSADYGKDIFTVPEDETRTRHHYLQIVLGATFYEGDYSNMHYEITGPGTSLDNWHLVGEEVIPNIYYYTSD